MWICEKPAVSLRLILIGCMTVFLIGCQSFLKQEKPESVTVPEFNTPSSTAAAPSVPTICAEPVEPEPIVIYKCPKSKRKSKPNKGLPIIGQLEKVIVMPGGIELNARIDTGATTSSMGVEHIEHYERDGKPWLKFTIKDPKTGKLHEFNAKRVRRVKIKQHDEEDQRRAVVKLRVILGKIDHVREFTLADRSNFKNPVLIGRNFLMASAIVDVSQKNTVHPWLPNK